MMETKGRHAGSKRVVEPIFFGKWGKAGNELEPPCAGLKWLASVVVITRIQCRTSMDTAEALEHALRYLRTSVDASAGPISGNATGG